MSIIRSWSGDGLSSGSVVAGNDDDSFSGVDGSPTLASDGSGSSAHIVIPDAGGVHRVRWWPLPGSPLASYASRVYLGMAGFNATCQLFRGNRGGADIWSLRVSSTGRLRIVSGESLVDGTAQLPIGGKVRVECVVSNNVVTAYAYSNHSTTLIDSVSLAISNASIDEIWIGKGHSSDISVGWTLDNLAVADTAVLIGPYVAEPNTSSHFRKTSDGDWLAQKVTILTDSEPDPPGDNPTLPYWGAPSFQQEWGSGQALDESIWYIREGFGLGHDSGYLERNNVVPGPTGLRMYSRRLDNPVVSGGRTRYVNSSAMWTQGTWSQRGGRYEAKIKMNWPNGVAPKLWPGWWTRAVGAPGEPDIMETIAGPHTREAAHPHGVPSYTIHESTNHDPGTVKIEHKEMTVDVMDGEWHTFAMEWWLPETHGNRAGFEFYRNDQLVWTARYSDYPWLHTSHPGDLYLRMDVQAGGSWHGYVDQADADVIGSEGQYMEIAWVRCWQHPDV